jgi:undecaprenyl-diphosphatase
MSWIEAFILGLLQGLTEFLPVSSSGHLELGSALFGLQNPDEAFTFNILVHGATFLSVVVVFRKDILNLLIQVLQFKWNQETQFIAMLVVSAFPVAIIGLLFEEQIEAIFQGRIVFVGCMLLLTAVILFMTRYAPHRVTEMNFPRALLIGVAQTIAILPGISRSGATISTALLLGIERTKAVRFSFLMVLIPVFGANMLKIATLSSENEITITNTTPLIVGTLTAFLAGLAACKWMISIVAKGRIEFLSAYCLLAGLAAIIAGLLL